MVWSRQDPHSRGPATLTTARSKRLAQFLKIVDPARDHRCTACHAPWQNLPENVRPANTSPASEAISCESCHGPAQNYIRSHTRRDLSRGEKLMDGLRDLTLLYNRANSCVACHQVVEPQLLEAGHPELLFELDGQTASMPRHWREKEANTHAIAWLTGQAAALRELTWQLIEETKKGKPSDRVFVQWQSALWVIKAALPQGALAGFETNAASSTERLNDLHRAADRIALEAPTQAEKLAQSLAAAEMMQAPVGAVIQAARAERLVTGLDRLLYGMKTRPAMLTERLEAMFALVQSRPDFNAQQFSSQLAAFREALGQYRD